MNQINGRLWKRGRTAARVSGLVHEVQSRPLRFLTLVLVALGVYTLGNLNGRRSHSMHNTLLLNTGEIAVGCNCPPCGIPEALRELIPPPLSKYDSLLKSTAQTWLMRWDKYEFQKSSISLKMVDNLWSHMLEHGAAYSAFRLKVVNGSLIWPATLMQDAVETNAFYMDRVNLWKSLFDKMAEAHGLPEYLDMVISIQNTPKILKQPFVADKAPLFGYTANQYVTDIPLPSTEYYAQVDSILPAEQEAAKKWDGRVAKAIWRGTPAGGQYTKDNFWFFPRSRLVNQTRANSDILDAKFLPCGSGQCDEKTWQAMLDAGLPSDTRELSFGEYTGYKFMVDIDGNGWSNIYAHVLGTGAVFFKADSSFSEYFYDFLVPYKDYIPIARDGSDLPEKLRYAVAHDDEMRLIHARILEKHSNLIGNGNWLKYAHFLVTQYSTLLERPKRMLAQERPKQLVEKTQTAQLSKETDTVQSDPVDGKVLRFGG